VLAGGRVVLQICPLSRHRLFPSQLTCTEHTLKNLLNFAGYFSRIDILRIRKQSYRNKFRPTEASDESPPGQVKKLLHSSPLHNVERSGEPSLKKPLTPFLRRLCVLSSLPGRLCECPSTSKRMNQETLLTEYGGYTPRTLESNCPAMSDGRAFVYKAIRAPKSHIVQITILPNEERSDRKLRRVIPGASTTERVFWMISLCREDD
jgi:hypothetical protein